MQVCVGSLTYRVCMLIITSWLVLVNPLYTVFFSCQLTTQYSNSETLVLLVRLKGHVKQKPRLARIVTWRLKWSPLEDVIPRELMFIVLVSFTDS